MAPKMAVKAVEMSGAGVSTVLVAGVAATGEADLCVGRGWSAWWQQFNTTCQFLYSSRVTALPVSVATLSFYLCLLFLY